MILFYCGIAGDGDDRSGINVPDI